MASEEAIICLLRMNKAARDVGGAHLVATTDKVIQESMKKAHHEFKTRKAQEEVEKRMKEIEAKRKKEEEDRDMSSSGRRC